MARFVVTDTAATPDPADPPDPPDTAGVPDTPPAPAPAPPPQEPTVSATPVPVITPPVIFGREPAVWVGVIEAALNVALVFGLVTQTVFGPIMAVVTAGAGVLVAYLTKDTMLAVILGLAKAALALVVTLAPGLNLSDVKVAGLLALVSVVAAAFQRTQTTPTFAPAADGTPSVTTVTSVTNMPGATTGSTPASTTGWDGLTAVDPFAGGDGADLVSSPAVGAASSPVSEA